MEGVGRELFCWGIVLVLVFLFMLGVFSVSGWRFMAFGRVR